MRLLRPLLLHILESASGGGNALFNRVVETWHQRKARVAGMSVWMSVTLSIAAAGPSAPIASVREEPIFVSIYRDCLLAIAVHRARTTSTPTDVILAEAFSRCVGIRRGANEGGVVGEDPKVSEARLARFDTLERQRLRTLIDANRGNTGG